MALLFMDGFEGSDYNLGKWTSSTGSNALVSSTRFGTGLAASYNSANGALRKDITAVAKVIVGCAFKLTNGADPTTNPLILLCGDASATQHLNLTAKTNGSLAINRAGTLLAASAAGVWALNAWHYVEMSATISDTVGVATVRLDGVQVVTFTGDTKSGGTNSSIDAIFFGGVTSNGSYLDDVYIADGTGAAPWNDFLGDVRVQLVKPNGAGSQTDLTPVGGANYANVDELPFSVADYNYSATAGQRDLYAMEDIAGSPSVLGVQVTTTTHKTDTTTRSVKNLVKSGATVTASAAKTLALSPVPYSAIFQVNPTTSAQWTAAEVNAMETGVEVV